MRKRWLISLTILFIGAVLLSPTPVLAQEDPPDDNGIVIWNEDYTLEEGERLEGDLIVFNGDVTLEPGSRVEGSVIIWNGSAEIEGAVEGDLVVSGGDITLGDSAWVAGEVVCTWNCDIEQKAGARVDGGIVEGIPLPPLPLDRIRPVPQVPSLPRMWDAGPGRVLNWMLRVIRSVVAIVVIAAVAGLVALIWPRQTAQVGRTVVEAPLPSLGIGLLTTVAGVALVIALAITICLSPVAVLALLALSAAGLFGWIAVGAMVGERFLQALNAHEITPMWAAGLGALLITLVSTGLSSAFCLAPLGWLLIFALGCLGLGAVALTRFGTMAYSPSTGAVPIPPSPPSAPAEGPTAFPTPEPAGMEEEETGATKDE